MVQVSLIQKLKDVSKPHELPKKVLTVCHKSQDTATTYVKDVVMVLILGGQDILTQNIGGAKHTFLPCFAPFSLDFPNF